MIEPHRPATLEDILQVILVRRGIDFRPYRRKTIERRLSGRMLLARAPSHDHYLELLESDPDEVDRLIERLTIKVSWFFRDVEVFSLLRERVLPELAQAHGPGSLRVWTAGCGNGEETYSLAVLLRETTPESAWRTQVLVGTDIDEGALNAAREGLYPASALQETAPETAAAYFTEEPGRGGPHYRVSETLRQAVRFVRHDLGAAEPPPPGGPFHLVCCRNVLIYFDRELQKRVQLLLRDSLAPGGVLCLGEAEWLLPEIAECFEVLDRRARLFRLKG